MGERSLQGLLRKTVKSFLCSEFRSLQISFNCKVVHYLMGEKTQSLPSDAGQRTRSGVASSPQFNGTESVALTHSPPRQHQIPQMRLPNHQNRGYLSQSFSPSTSDSLSGSSLGSSTEWSALSTSQKTAHLQHPPSQSRHPPPPPSKANSESVMPEGEYIPMYPLGRPGKKGKKKPPLHHHHTEIEIPQKIPPCLRKSMNQTSRSKSFHVGERHVNKHTLSRVLDTESPVLPQILKVTRGQGFQWQTGTSKERETLRTGDFVLAHCKKARYIVKAITPSGIKIVIPLNSHLKFVLAPKGVSEIAHMTRYSQGLYPNVESLSQQPQLPIVVRTTAAHNADAESESVVKDRILFPRAIAKKNESGSMQLAANDLAGTDYCLREDCLAGFSTKVNDTWLFISEIVENFSLPQNVFVATHQLLAASEVGGNRDLVSDKTDIKSQLLTLTAVQQQHYLIATKNHSTDLVLEIPLDLDIEVECVSIKDKALDGMNILQTARDIYKDVQEAPGQLVLSTTMSEREQDFQEELYKATGDMEDLIELRNMAGGRSYRERPQVISSPEREIPTESHRKRGKTLDKTQEKLHRPKSGALDISVIRAQSSESLHSGSPEMVDETDQSDVLKLMKMELARMKEEHTRMKSDIDSFEKQLKSIEKKVGKKSKK